MKADNITDYNSTQYKDFINKYRTEESQNNKLIVLAGEFTQNRKSAIDEIKRETMGDALEVDTRELITSNEEESYAKIDACVKEISSDTPLVIFRNAEHLNGAYTGYSNSLVIYSTPQEKYFLKKVKEIPAPVVMEMSNSNMVDATLSRSADMVVLFDPPTSFLEKMAWKFQNIHIHGSRFLSPRPVNK